MRKENDKDENEKLDVSRPTSDSQVGLVDYIDEFVQALRKQLHSDFLRWGNTWRNRPKEGQEMRTEARYKDYFDQFYATGEPVPWLKIVGNALICWIRDNHPELYIDSDAWAAELAGVPSLKGVKVSADGVEEAMPVPPVEEYSEADVKDTTIRINPISHIEGEKLQGLLGLLTYRPRGKDDGCLVLESIVFRTGPGPKDKVAGKCDASGVIKRAADNFGVDGIVQADGRYGIASSVGLLAADTLYVSYDYEYTLPEDKTK